MSESTGKAIQTRSMFRMECGVSTAIDASAETVWRLLTDVDGYTTWNSTLTSIEGDITQGGSVSMQVPEAPGRTFKVKVTEFTPQSRMVWKSGFFPMFEGKRTFTLQPQGEGVVFSMVEVFRGLMLPMIIGHLPSFGPIFEQYAADLKQQAEA